MKAVILAGGLGTRLQEETRVKPKPMVEIGGKPILWHIMNIFSSQGINEFIIALGYKGEVIKDYFVNYHVLRNDVTVHLGNGKTEIHDGDCENWVIHLIDTGPTTQTGGRVKRLARWIGNEPFLLTYGDGVANINLNGLIDFHTKLGKIATVTAVRPPARFGGISFDGDLVERFEEKPQIGEGWINGGFFVFEPDVFEYIDGDDIALEREPLERLSGKGELAAYRHEGFWQCMDTLRDLQLLDRLWANPQPPWKIW